MGETQTDRPRQSAVWNEEQTARRGNGHSDRDRRLHWHFHGAKVPSLPQRAVRNSAYPMAQNYVSLSGRTDGRTTTWHGNHVAYTRRLFWGQLLSACSLARSLGNRPRRRL